MTSSSTVVRRPICYRHLRVSRNLPHRYHESYCVRNALFDKTTFVAFAGRSVLFRLASTFLAVRISCKEPLHRMILVEGNYWGTHVQSGRSKMHQLLCSAVSHPLEAGNLWKRGIQLCFTSSGVLGAWWRYKKLKKSRDLFFFALETAQFTQRHSVSYWGVRVFKLTLTLITPLCELLQKKKERKSGNVFPPLSVC